MKKLSTANISWTINSNFPFLVVSTSRDANNKITTLEWQKGGYPALKQVKTLKTKQEKQKLDEPKGKGDKFDKGEIIIMWQVK